MVSPPPPDPSRYDDDLRLALAIADAVDELTTARFRAGDLRVETKPDLTPVTDADRAAEALVRAELGRVRPHDGVLGEEMATTTGSGSRQWVVDPIDGTKSYVRGVPVWATLLALVDDGEPVVGVVSAPALHRRWWAARGTGAWVGAAGGSAPDHAAPTRLRVSAVADLSDASLSSSDLPEWEAAGLLRQFTDLTRAVWRSRGYGDFWSYVLVAEGVVDVACEPDLAVHDMAALAPVVGEAGGRFTDLRGVDGPFGRSAVATNGLLHAQVLRRLSPST